MTFSKSSENHDRMLNTKFDGRSVVGKTMATSLDRGQLSLVETSIFW